MRLRTLESFGLINNGIINSYPSLHGEHLQCEIAVIGAGITGALVSHALREKGYQVILLDKRDVASGSTAATTSLLQYEIDMPLFRLAKLIGEEGAATCYTAGVEAIHQLRKLIESYELDCKFETKKSLYIAQEEKDSAWLEKEYEIRNKYKLGVTWLERQQLQQTYGLYSAGGICSDTAACVDAYRLTHELIAYNAGKGLKTYDQTEIKEFHLKEKQPYLLTKTNCKVTFRKIIFCTGYEAIPMIKERIAKLFYTYACVSERNIKLSEELKGTLLWDSGSPYFYMRYTDDNRLLIGGEDSTFNFPFFQQFIKERKSGKLQQIVKRLIKDIHFIEDFCWAGKFGSTKDGLPYIGASPEYENALFVLGFGGNGITFSVQAMRIITAILAEEKHDLIHPYRFGR
jgi:glycine/D-amino acid oxidase-like deaminating enzyme